MPVVRGLCPLRRTTSQPASLANILIPDGFHLQPRRHMDCFWEWEQNGADGEDDMSGRQLTVAMAVVAVTALPLLAEDAKPRGSSGGSSRGSSHASHHGGSSRGSSSGGSNSGSGYHPSGGSSRPSPTLTDAQRRHPRAGTGTGYRYPGYGNGYGHGGYYGGYGHYPYYPYYSRPYYWGYGSYPWGGLYFDSYWYGGGSAPYYSSSHGYGYYSTPYGDTGSIRMLIDQEKAKVYVDGYYAGVVDDFDGLFQRLYVSPGRHEIAVKLDGYKTERFEVYVQNGSTVKIGHDMVRGEGEQRNMEYAPLARNQEPAEREAPREDRYAPNQDDRAQGTLRLDVRPDDASVYVDGTFSGSARELRQLPLSAGRHRIEIVRPGFRTYDRDVEVDGGRGTDLSVELEK